MVVSSSSYVSVGYHVFCLLSIVLGPGCFLLLFAVISGGQTHGLQVSLWEGTEMVPAGKRLHRKCTVTWAEGIFVRAVFCLRCLDDFVMLMLSFYRHCKKTWTTVMTKVLILFYEVMIKLTVVLYWSAIILDWDGCLFLEWPWSWIHSSMTESIKTDDYKLLQSCFIGLESFVPVCLT